MKSTKQFIMKHIQSILLPLVLFFLSAGITAQDYVISMTPTLNGVNCTGTISVMITGDAPPFTITLEDGITSQVVQGRENHFTDKPEGDYVLTIVDGMGCDFTQDIKVECECPLPKFEVVLPDCHLGIMVLLQ